jgi:hypothetical protein
MQAQRHRHVTTTKLAGIAVLAAAAALLAGCGASSAPKAGAPPTSTSQTTTQRAHPTPAQSNADVGGAQGQTTTAQPGSAGSHKVRPKISEVKRGHVVQRAHLVAATSKDDSGSAAAIRINPCRLVSVSEAEAITGGPISGRVEAPLGPTCIYRQAGSKTDITLAVETTTFASATHGMSKPTKVLIKGRSAYCGKLGAQMLFVPLPDGTVLNVTAPCAVAQRFAATALSRLIA